MKSNPLSPTLEAFRSNRVHSCCFIKSTYFSFKSFNSLVLSLKCVRSSLRDSICSSLGILEYTHFHLQSLSQVQLLMLVQLLTPQLHLLHLQLLPFTTRKWPFSFRNFSFTPFWILILCVQRSKILMQRLFFHFIFFMQFSIKLVDSIIYIVDAIIFKILFSIQRPYILMPKC